MTCPLLLPDTSAPPPPRRPRLEQLVEVCGGEGVEGMWEGLGAALEVPDSELKRISEAHDGDAAKCSQEVFKVRL